MKNKNTNYRLDQRVAKENFKDVAKVGRRLFNGATAYLGINQFKRDHKGDNYLIAEYKKNAWATADPSKVRRGPVVSGIQTLPKRKMQFPAEMTNHEKMVWRTNARRRIKETQNAKSAS